MATGALPLKFHTGLFRLQLVRFCTSPPRLRLTVTSLRHIHLGEALRCLAEQQGRAHCTTWYSLIR